MFFFNKLLGFRDFSKLEEIKKTISSKFNFDKDENIDKAKELIIFETSRQKTWIIATEKKLFCVLDNVENDTFEIRWHMAADEIIKDNKIDLDIKVVDSYKKNTGLVDFGKNHREWLYSKKYFSSPDKLREKVAELLTHKMLKSAN